MLQKIKKQVEKNQNKIFYKIGKDSITYKDLWEKAKIYADCLKRQGTTPVIIYGNKELYVVISIIACLIANRAYVPISKQTPLLRINSIIKQTKSKLIISDQKIIEDIDCCRLEELKQFKNNELCNINTDVVYIIFTSGSTGIPKGVPISKNNLNNFIDWISNLNELKEQKNINVLNQANFSFDLSVADFYYSLCNGHTLIAINDLNNYENIFSTIKKENINLAVATPTFMKLCLLNNEFNEKKYKKLNTIYFCGEILETETVQKIFNRFPNITIINAYGPTEATSAISAINITKEMLDEEILPVGDINTLATKVEIIDDEIVLKGKSVSKGYLNNLTGGFYKEKNINCYKTGDIGFIKDNKLFCKGRKDNQIKYKGYRIELNDIEKNILKIKEIKECIVLANYAKENKVKNIKAFITLNKNITENLITEKLKEILPNYMIPARIVILDEFPVNQNGKVDRKELAKL